MAHLPRDLLPFAKFTKIPEIRFLKLENGLDTEILLSPDVDSHAWARRPCDGRT